VLKDPDHLEASAIPDMGQAGVAVPAEVPLEDAAVPGPIEKRAPLLQLEHPLGCLPGVDLRHAPVVEHLPAANGVPKVDLPVVLGIDGAEGRGHPALGHHRVGLAEERLADEGRAGALGARLDGGPQAGAAGADHYHVELVDLALRHQNSLGSLITPIDTRRT
jgi:hypothetical protein